MKLTLVPLLVLVGGSLFAQDYYRGYGDRSYDRDLHSDYRDISHDYTQLDRFRADVARDQYQLNAAMKRGDESAASHIARDLARDQRALNALRADIRSDHRDIRRDQQHR